MERSTSSNAVLVSVLLSVIWIAAAIQDIRTQRMSNTTTIGAFALAFGYRVGNGTDTHYYLSLGSCIVVALAFFASNLVRGGDAKLLLSVLAWQPAIETWIVALVCLSAIGGPIVAWSRLRHGGGKLVRITHRYPLGGVITIAGLVVLWVL